VDSLLQSSSYGKCSLSCRSQCLILDTIPNRRLFMYRAAYTDLCLCIGRGQSSTRSDRIEVLGADRLSVYKKIAASSCGMQMDGDHKSGTPFRWPLWLSLPHRVLMTSNLVTEPILEQTSAPDRLIVNGFIAGISWVYGSLGLLLRDQPDDPTSRLMEEGIPLSLNNARLFAVAVLRLPKEERLASFSALLAAVHSGIMGIKSDEFLRHEKCSGFVARTVVVCSRLAIELTCNTGDSVLNDVSRISHPSRLPSTQPTIEPLQTEACYVGLHDSAGSLGFHNSELSASNMDNEMSQTLQSILKEAFRLSFSVAPTDGCYLLFASWSALGGSSLWTNNEVTKIAPYKGLPDDLSKLILDLRNEMCYVNRLIRAASSRSNSVSGLNRIIDQRDSTIQSTARADLVAKVKKELRAMLTKASDVSDDLLARLIPEDEDVVQEIPIEPIEVLAILEAVTVYLSFAVASHTQPDSDFFTHIRTKMNIEAQKRPRGYSSDSEYPSDDANSMDSRDGTLEAADRLENACAVFGAVPAYPDWLDKVRSSCSCCC